MCKFYSSVLYYCTYIIQISVHSLEHILKVEIFSSIFHVCAVSSEISEVHQHPVFKCETRSDALKVTDSQFMCERFVRNPVCHLKVHAMEMFMYVCRIALQIVSDEFVAQDEEN